MADKITAKNDGTKFTPHPEGQFVAICADVIDLGERAEKYQDQPTKIVHKAAIVFLSGERNAETGVLHDATVEVTISMGEKANLRKFLASWRGKPYTDEEADAGVPLDKLEGVPALLSVAHKKSAKGRTYAIIASISPLFKGMVKPDIAGYERPKYWEERKQSYREEVALVRGTSLPADVEAQGEDDSDDLPF